VAYFVELREAEPQQLGVVRDRANRATLSGKITGSPVWSLIRGRGLANGGHNVVVYHCLPADEFDIEVGVDVFAPFESDERLISTTTPGGLVVTTRHVGPYDRMSGAHAAIWARISRDRLTFSGVSWEWYGHWSDDPSALRTDIFYLVDAPDGGSEENP
jgi:effector-binding domain-containing protein